MRPDSWARKASWGFERMAAVHYFAYGSNMLTTRLRARTPSARPLHLATLPGRRLAFHKQGKDGSGKCDIAPGRPADQVIGVVFQLDEAELPALDRAEGAGYGYARAEVIVRQETTELACVCYEATRIDPTLQPFGWYRQLVIAGLLEHGAPDWYLRQVMAVGWLHDPDPHRHAQRGAVRALTASKQAHPHLSALLAGGHDDPTSPLPENLR